MKITLSILLLLTMQISIAQTNNDNINSNPIQKQISIINKIISALENSQIDFASYYFDSDIQNLKTDLKNISIKINEIKDTTKLSIVLVFDEGHNIYRCRYVSGDDEIYQIDLHFKENEANSKVIKLNTKDHKTLQKEKEERINADEIPPAPEDY